MALGETAIHTSPSHHYICLRSLLPSRLSSSHFVWSVPYATSVFPSSRSLFVILLRRIYCGHYLLRGSTPIDCCIILIVFSFLFISLVTSANASIHESGVCRNLFLLHILVGRPLGRILRAEPSSNGSSDPPSDSSSELSSHQIPRRLRVPLRLKGCTGSFTLSSPTTPSGASVLQVHFALCHSTSASGPNRRVPPPRGLPPRQSIPDTSFFLL